MISKFKSRPWLLVAVLFSVAVACWTLGLRESAQAAREGTENVADPQASGPDRLNGFDLSNSAIPKKEILRGGPPRDGIPALDNPKFLGVEEIAFLENDDPVISVTVGKETRAYPLRVLVWHEIVNDEIGDRAFTVTYCPLCGTAMVFNRMVQGEKLNFGVSGLLYHGDVLMYDRQTESLWSQLAMKCVAGKQLNAALEWLPSQQLAWSAWKAKNPQGGVLSTNTGFERDYTESPYKEYFKSPNPPFKIQTARHDLPDKAWVLGLIVGGQPKAYPLDRLANEKGIVDTVGGVKVELNFDAASRSASVTEVDRQKPVPVVQVYWFAWQAFYPNTSLWMP